MISLTTACTTPNSTADVSRQLPALPEWVAPVTTPEPKKGEELLVVAVRERLAKAQANRRLEETRNWYEQIRSAYAGEGKNE